MQPKYLSLVFLVCTSAMSLYPAFSGIAMGQDLPPGALEKQSPHLSSSANARLLYMGASTNDCTIISYGLRTKHDINHNWTDGTPLYIAATLGHAEALTYLLEQGANPDQILKLKPKEETTALLGAVQYKQTKAVEILLEHGANIDIATCDKKTALLQAVSDKDLPLVDLLLKKGADVNGMLKADDVRVASPIDVAVSSGDYAMTKRLLQENLNLNHLASKYLKDRWSRAGALHGAIANNDPLMVSLLLQAGADPSIVGTVDYVEFSALQYAIEVNANPVIIELLLIAGAEYKAVNAQIDAALLRIAAREARGEVMACVDDHLYKDLRNMVMDYHVEAEAPAGVEP